MDDERMAIQLPVLPAYLYFQCDIDQIFWLPPGTPSMNRIAYIRIYIMNCSAI